MNRTRTLLALLGISAFLLAACGDSGDGEGGHGGEHAHGGEGGEGGEGTGGTPAEGGGGAAPTLLNGCDRATADDMTGQAEVALEWDLTHQECIIVDVGTTVTWTGDFSFHPLKGGETGEEDTGSPITDSDQTGASASVTFDAAGEFPYFCNVHFSSMQGVVYVE